MLERISKKFGLTQTELKIALFIIVVFIFGLAYKVFFDKQESVPYQIFDYNSQSFDNIQKKVLPAEKSINLNTAKLEELVNLPGIGPKTAQNIIDYRDLHKRFNDINELLKVKNIGEAKFTKIKKYIFID